MKFLFLTVLMFVVCLHANDTQANATLSEWKVRLIPHSLSENTGPQQWMLATDMVISKKYIGYIEYAADLQVSALDNNNPFGIYLGDISDSDKTYVNGVLIGSTGGFPPTYQGYIDYVREYLIPTAILSTEHVNQITILVYVEYPAKKGMNVSTVRVGRHTQLQNLKFFHEIMWYFSKLLMPFICAILAAIVFLHSSSKCNSGTKDFRWCFVVETLSGPMIQPALDGFHLPM